MQFYAKLTKGGRQGKLCTIWSECYYSSLFYNIYTVFKRSNYFSNIKQTNHSQSLNPVLTLFPLLILSNKVLKYLKVRRALNYHTHILFCHSVNTITRRAEIRQGQKKFIGQVTFFTVELNPCCLSPYSYIFGE